MAAIHWRQRFGNACTVSHPALNNDHLPSDVVWIHEVADMGEQEKRSLRESVEDNMRSARFLNERPEMMADLRVNPSNVETNVETES